jgi:hypothetical protein
VYGVVVRRLAVTSVHVLYSAAICVCLAHRCTLSSCAHLAATAAVTCMSMMFDFSSEEDVFAFGTGEPYVDERSALITTVATFSHQQRQAHLLPPSSEIWLPNRIMRPAYRPRFARRSRFFPVRYEAPDAMLTRRTPAVANELSAVCCASPESGCQ